MTKKISLRFTFRKHTNMKRIICCFEIKKIRRFDFNMENTDKEPSLLREFLRSIEEVPKQIVEAVLKVSENEDEKNVINAFAPAFVNQFRELSVAATERAGIVSRQKLNEAEDFLRISSGNILADNLKIALPSIGSVVGKLGIAGLVQEIKKVIKKLFEILHFRLPEQFWAIANLIDEILHNLLGLGSIKMRNALSDLERNFLTEVTQLAKLEKASQFQVQDDDDDDDN